MNKDQFLRLLGEAYDFPGYYSRNLDSADEILGDMKQEAGREKLSLEPFFAALLADAPEAERRAIWALLTDHFAVEGEVTAR